MRYISVCSGIEAASVAWEQLGWEPVAFAEIDPFPNAVLAHRFPNVPNLGDISQVDWRPYRGKVDLVVGGTPCQSFSIAGKREGLDGASGLVREYFRLLEEVKPKYFVWENVPGAFSIEKGSALEFILSQYEDLGYVYDVDVLDAQFFGVAQRRRRIFVCGINLEDLVKMRTIFSAKITLSFLAQLLRKGFTELLLKSENGLAKSVSPDLLSDGLKRRMRLLFKPTMSDGVWITWLENLKEVFLKQVTGLKNLDSFPGGIHLDELPDGWWNLFKKENLSGNTAQLWNDLLEDLYLLRKWFTISTEIRITTKSTIYTFSKAALITQNLILLSICFCRNYSEEEWLDLINLQDFTSYARQASRSLLEDEGYNSRWSDFIREAIQSETVIRDIRRRPDRFKVLFEPESLSGNPPPSRKAKEEVTQIAGTLSANGGGDY